ncbi:Esterase/lipase/thioesterase [Arachnomyces sp. PD_36]|nr:Esterase/lipase/thioesterase [Arachnomyces sp. PD_36]
MKSSTITSIAWAIALRANLAAAHGYVSSAIINGENNTGYLPYSDPYQSPPIPRIFRKIAGNGPVMDFSLIDAQCGGYEGSGSAPAELTADATAGGEITLQWTKWPGSHKGPIITYMAKCPADCSSFDPGKEAVWFKVAEDGKHADGSWATDPLINEVPYKFTIPEALAPGNYVVRHEVWGLHSAWEYPGAQLYPSCFQVKVTGSGSGQPTELVSFPGEYTADTPGVVFDVYQGEAEYPIPGPAVWTG